ncbi:MAG: shikimate dehydrogenase [Thaumarchaeota archaeon]|nr:MAG: shikimate dehydrogenase [Nitrososphaerota archaeon]
MKVSVIAEIGSNWEGSMNKAERIIKECKKAGADAVKFQMWRANDLYNDTHPNWKFIKKSELTFKKTQKLKSIADKIGIEFFCSAFYPEAVDFLEKIKVKRYKIASRTCLLKDPFSLETLEKKSYTKKPVIISMGMGGDFKKIEKIFSKNNKIFCYCISEYPTNINDIKWKNAIKYNGFSDHTLGITASLIFTMLKKQQNSKKLIIEKHVKLINSKGPDASSSIDTNELKALVTGIRQIEKLKI